MTINEIQKEYLNILGKSAYGAPGPKRDLCIQQGKKLAFDFLKSKINEINFVLDDIDEIFNFVQKVVENDDIECFKLFLDSGFKADTINSKFETIFNHPYNIMLKKLDFIKIMYEYGTNLTKKNKDGNNLYSLVLLCSPAFTYYGEPNNNAYEIFNYLMSLPYAKDQINDTFGSGKMLFHIAIEKNKKPEARLILKSGFDINTMCSIRDPRHRDNISCNALHLACSAGLSDMVSFLADEGADLNYTSSDGRSPAHFSLTLKNMDIQLSKDDEDRFKNRSVNLGKNAFWRTDVLEKLKYKGANLNIKCNGKTPLFTIMWNRLYNSYNTDRDTYEIISSKLIELDADVTAVDDDGTAIIHLACGLGDFKILKKCVDAGVDINQRNNKGETPLLMACGSHLYGKDTDKVIMTLIRLGADTEAANKKNETALDILSQKGKKELVEFLLEHKGI